LPEFTVICEERYNQIRNASHHGMTMERETQTIHYRTRKGGTGPKQKIRYATYLARSAKLFLQALPLPVIEGSRDVGFPPELAIPWFRVGANNSFIHGELLKG
jgi:hypothetical protein